MSYISISTRKYQILNYLKIYMKKHGIAPTLTEIANEFEISRERVNQVLDILVTDKKIRKTKDATRNIELL